MSASREKQNRQATAGQADPKTAREAQPVSYTHLTLPTICSV